MRQYREISQMTLEEKHQEWNEIVERLINKGADWWKLEKYLRSKKAGSSKYPDWSLTIIRNLEIEVDRRIPDKEDEWERLNKIYTATVLEPKFLALLEEYGFKLYSEH